MKFVSSAQSTVNSPLLSGYSVGSLTYTRRGIVTLFGWLLWGDFAFTFFEQVLGRFLPLYLKDLNASNTVIGITAGCFAGLVNVVFLPGISQWSDRFRSCLGRRIPFLLVVTPLAVIALLGIGFAPEIGGWMFQHAVIKVAPWITMSTVLLSFLCTFAILFHFFNMVLVNAYNWLLHDVVPQVFMARFLSWFRIVDTVASVLFLWYVFPTMLDHRRETFSAIGVFYLLAFMLMCWRVKEGEYPDPEPRPSGSNILSRYYAYFRDCLSLPIYRNFFIAYVLVAVGSSCPGSFVMLYARDNLNLDMDNLGRIFAYAALASAILYVPVGWLCDKFSATQVTLTSLIFLVTIPLSAFFLVVDKSSFLIYSIVAMIPWVSWTLGSLVLSMHLFPEEVFGEFSAGLNVFGCGGSILGYYLIGILMDFNGSDYRAAFLWKVFFFGSAILPMLFVFRDWKRNGGPDNYIPPLPDHLQMRRMILREPETE